MFFWCQRAKNETDDNEATCDRPDNPYTVSSALAQHPNGVRLDYVMYRANAGEFSASESWIFDVTELGGHILWSCCMVVLCHME